MKRIIFALTSIYLLSSLLASAQTRDKLTIARIKVDPAYYWAEGKGKQYEEAVQAADKELLAQVVGVFMHAETDFLKTEKEGTLTREYSQRVKSLSVVYLKGLKHLTIKERKNWIALSYIHRDSLANSFALRRTKIREFYRQAMSSATEGRVGECLRNLYWGFLLSNAFPDTLHLTLPDGQVSSNPKNAFHSLINNTLQDIQISAAECYRDGQTILVPLTFTYHGQAIRELSYSYYSYFSGAEGLDYGRVVNGTDEIRLYDEPTCATRALTFNIYYTYENDMGSDEEIAALHEIFKGSVFNNKKIVNLHFPWMESSREEKKILESVYTGPYAVKHRSDIFLEALDQLSQAADSSQFAEYINQYLKLNILTIGRPEDFANHTGCYVAILGGGKHYVRELVFFDGQRFRGVKSGRSYSDLAVEFPGLGQLWFIEKKE